MRRILGTLLLIAAGAATQQASAGVSPPFINGVRYEQNGTATCPPQAASSGTSGTSGTAIGIINCQLLYPAPPAGKKLVLKNVSCRVRQTTDYLKDIYVAVNLNGSIQRRQYLTFLFGGSNDVAGDSGTFFIVNQAIQDYVVTSPVRVVAEVTGDGTYIFMDCQISGVLEAA